MAAAGNQRPFRFGAWRVDPARGVLTGDGGEEARLEPRLMDLLLLFAGSGGRVLSKDQIVEAVWEGRAIGDDTLAAAISRLRRALGETPRAPLHRDLAQARLSGGDPGRRGDAVRRPARRRRARRGRGAGRAGPPGARLAAAVEPHPGAALLRGGGAPGAGLRAGPPGPRRRADRQPLRGRRAGVQRGQGRRPRRRRARRRLRGRLVDARHGAAAGRPRLRGGGRGAAARGGARSRRCRPRIASAPSPSRRSAGSWRPSARRVARSSLRRRRWKRAATFCRSC